MRATGPKVGNLISVARGTCAPSRPPATRIGGDGMTHNIDLILTLTGGLAAGRLLRENGVEPTVVEMNVETVQRLRAEGVAAVYGDAARPETLTAAGVGRASVLMLSASGIKGAQEVVRLARELNPAVRVVARSAYLRERADLRGAGADVVFSGEGEVALAMTEMVLRELGASPDQIDRERERVRADLFGDAAAVPPGGDGKDVQEQPDGVAKE